MIVRSISTTQGLTTFVQHTNYKVLVVFYITIIFIAINDEDVKFAAIECYINQLTNITL